MYILITITKVRENVRSDPVAPHIYIYIYIYERYWAIIAGATESNHTFSLALPVHDDTTLLITWQRLTLTGATGSNYLDLPQMCFKSIDFLLFPGIRYTTLGVIRVSTIRISGW